MYIPSFTHITFIQEYTEASLETVAELVSKSYEAFGPGVQLRQAAEKLSTNLYVINISTIMKIYIGDYRHNEHVSNNAIFLEKFINNRI
jgi:hypothetical protein